MSLYWLPLILLLGGVLLYDRLKAARRAKHEPAPRLRREQAGSTIPDRPIGFGYKCAWYAIHSSETERIARAFGSVQLQPCNWKAGIAAAYDGSTFLTPAVNGWTLVVRAGMDDNEAQVRLVELSNEFGEAQFFSTHRIVEFHCWGKANHGHLVRFHAFDGESTVTLVNIGDPIELETGLNLFNSLGPEARTEGYFDRDDLDYPDEQLVKKIAAAWSIDPTTLEERTELGPGLGLLCKDL